VSGLKRAGILLFAICILMSGCSSNKIERLSDEQIREVAWNSLGEEVRNNVVGSEGDVGYRVDPFEGKVIGQQKGALPPDTIVDVVPEKPNDYAVDANGTFLALQDWSDEVDLEKILGSPKSDQIDILTNADTLNGSRTKYITYDGLDIELFSPSQEEDRFWILSMKLTKDRYSTSRGISVGDSVSDLKAAYPGIQLAPDGRTDENNGAYLMSDENRFNRLWFEVAEGEISEIRIYHEIP
jgi:hypothetical protein